VSRGQAAQHFVQAREFPTINRDLNSHIEEIWRGDSCQIMECASCGFGFAWPYVAGDTTFYNLAYPHVAYPSARWEFDRTIEAIKGQNLRESTVLEVGAGYGFFLDRLCQMGATESLLTATEYNNIAIDRLRSRGYRVIENDVRSDALLAMREQFDLIALFQVVEHMDRLDDLFKRIFYLAKPGASIFIAVPNTDHTNYQEAHDSLIDMPPNHIGRWTINAFRRISSRHRLDLRQHETQPFDTLKFLKTDVVFSHVRRAQDRPNSPSGTVRSMRRSKFRTALEVATIAAYGFSRIPHWATAFQKRQGLGLSLWVHLVRN
jgi:2-polyprenyl-3-methyl-5-hydroxy-6-metoxy-1,4-benzoquinol methylase